MNELTAVVIEDDPDVAELVAVVLEQCGLRVIAVTDGAAGLDAVRRHQPVLTTLDLNLPDSDGFDIARQLRTFSDTHLMISTGMAGSDAVVQGLEAGADDYLIKPFRPRDLRMRVVAVLDRLEAERTGDLPEAEDVPAPC